MFGSEFSDYPEALIQSLIGMNANYQRNTPHQLTRILQKLFVRIFGIPEIGFQIRSMYFQKALKNLTKLHPNNLLDVGSGIGAYVLYLAKRYPLSEVDGWEIDRAKIRFSQQFLKNQRISNATISFADITKSRKITRKYDFILSIDVLEHIREYETVVENFFHLLKPDGYLYIHVPHEKQKRYFSRFNHWSHEGHVRVGFNLSDLKKTLTNTGFTVVSAEFTFGKFGSLAWEINHLLLSRSLLLAGIIYPLVYVLAVLDLQVFNRTGLGIALLARKESAS